VTGLELDPATHRYTYAGQRVGGVTEILQALGIVDARWFTDEGRLRGTAVHLAIQLHLEGTLDPSTVDPRIRGYVDAALDFLQVAGIRPGMEMLIERRVFHPILRYAGTLDLVVRAFGIQTLIDWKTGEVGAVALSTAAYLDALRAEVGPGSLLAPRRRMVVQLREDGTYRKTDLVDPMDSTRWQMCVTLFNLYHLPRRKQDVRSTEHRSAAA
jgi:hypothetical protein